MDIDQNNIDIDQNNMDIDQIDLLQDQVLTVPVVHVGRGRPSRARGRRRTVLNERFNEQNARQNNMVIDQIDLLQEQVPTVPVVHVGRGRQSRARGNAQLTLNRALFFNENTGNTQPFYLGQMTARCMYCGSLNFNQEKVSGHFSICCNNGKVIIPSIRQHPQFQYLMTEHCHKANFLDNIREYNNALAFASLTVRSSINISKQYNDIWLLNGGPPCFRVHGQMHRNIGPITPQNGEKASFLQLYFIDAERALAERSSNVHNKKCLEDVMRILQNILLEVNPLAQQFTHMKQLFQHGILSALNNNQPINDMDLFIVNKNNCDKRRYNLPTAAHEVAAVFQSSDGAPPNIEGRTLSVLRRETWTGFEEISIVNPGSDALLYPLVFPYGDEGFKDNIQHVGPNVTRVKNKVSIREFYSARLATTDRFSFLHGSRKLFQQIVIDWYLRIEGSRLKWIMDNQVTLRADTYRGIVDHLADNDAPGVPAGRTVILPSSFQGSPRNMHSHYQDAMAVVRKFGKPTFFITFTCNPKWREITENLAPHELAAYRPDLVSRVFKLRLNELMRDLTVNHCMGKNIAFIYVVEWQKRGLPHAHILLIQDDENIPKDPEAINRAISAEIPDSQTNAELYSVVSTHMVHGPCGNENPNAPCMNNGVCEKGFPKEFNAETNVNVDGYPKYRRRDTGATIQVRLPGNRLIDYDNRRIVPYNPHLLLKFRAHINVELVSTVKSVKYLYKYCYKGYDSANVEGVTVKDEVKLYMDARYVTSPEAAHRIFGYPLHDKSHAVVTLQVHLPYEQQVFFHNGEEQQALQRALTAPSMLLSWFKLNNEDESAHNFTYAELPYHYCWNKTNHVWTRRRVIRKIVPRLNMVSPKNTELFALRLLLLHTPGAKSWNDLRNVDGVVYATFREAALKRQLLSDDDVWKTSLEDASHYQMPAQLRDFFAYIIAFGGPSDPASLWLQFKQQLSEDYNRSNDQDHAEQLALADIHRVLQINNTECTDIPQVLINQVLNVSLYDQRNENILGQELLDTLNVEQRVVVDRVMSAVQGNERQKLFFLAGAGGTGKTYIYKCLLHLTRGVGKLPLAVAFTGIAATLLPGGRTAHSMFNLPVPLLETSVSLMTPASKKAKPLRESSLIIFDEAPMAPGRSLKVIDLLLREITQLDAPFGGKVVVLGGDFRQVLPVMRNATRAAQVGASLKRCDLWGLFEILQLKVNMRAGAGEKEFSSWLTKLGDGKIETFSDSYVDSIALPHSCITTASIVEETFGNNLSQDSVEQFHNRAILCPLNEDCLKINNEIVQKIPGESTSYKSVDELVTDDENEIRHYPTEFLNTIHSAGLPPHDLILKPGAVVMLIRNLNTAAGIVNGTRLIVKRLSSHTLEAEVVTGEARGKRILIPKIDTAPSDMSLPFTIKRRQFPVRVAFAITINKSQGQTFERIGLYLPRPVFSHGMLYVAFSRVRSLQHIKVKVDQCEKQGCINNTTFTSNVVYREIL